MTTQTLTYQQIMLFARQLPLEERVRLVIDILAMPLHEAEQETQQPEVTEPLETLYGAFAGQGPVPSEHEIRAARREAWGRLYQ
jgi:hypothetical protein